ncbi:MAG: hypothetical protein K9M03_03865 [Kiritimatiellales bacterium]|nr:hypothetical protein [Kiritimatiellales bacterium]
MSTLENKTLLKFYDSLKESFYKLFVEQNSKENIVNVIYAIRQDKPVLPIMEAYTGSFSTIFLPFHAGMTYPFDFKNLSSKHKMHPKLIEFCKLAAQIEGITDEMATFNKEPPVQPKENLKIALEKFLEILPSYNEFESWLI